jgi:homoserine O-succinyltransferase
MKKLLISIGFPIADRFKLKLKSSDISLLNYQSFQDIKDQKFDGLIITGAPIEHLEFEAVDYWQELTEIMDWTQTNVHSTLGVCWGGMAMINYFHGVKKHMLDAKLFGCYRHQNLAPASPYLRGFSDDCVIPVSRWTEMRQSEIDASSNLTTLLGSEEAGPCLVQDPDHRAIYIFNHFAQTYKAMTQSNDTQQRHLAITRSKDNSRTRALAHFSTNNVISPSMAFMGIARNLDCGADPPV